LQERPGAVKVLLVHAGGQAHGDAVPHIHLLGHGDVLAGQDGVQAGHRLPDPQVRLERDGSLVAHVTLERLHTVGRGQVQAQRIRHSEPRARRRERVDHAGALELVQVVCACFQERGHLGGNSALHGVVDEVVQRGHGLDLVEAVEQRAGHLEGHATVGLHVASGHHHPAGRDAVVVRCQHHLVGRGLDARGRRGDLVKEQDARASLRDGVRAEHDSLSGLVVGHGDALQVRGFHLRQAQVDNALPALDVLAQQVAGLIHALALANAGLADDEHSALAGCLVGVTLGDQRCYVANSQNISPVWGN